MMGSAQPAMRTPLRVGPPAAPDDAMAAWRAEKRAEAEMVSSQVLSRRKAKPASSTAEPTQPNFRPGDWICECKQHNFADKTHCRRCRRTLKQEYYVDFRRVLAPADRRRGDWHCPVCGG